MKPIGPKPFFLNEKKRNKNEIVQFAIDSTVTSRDSNNNNNNESFLEGAIIEYSKYIDMKS